MNNRHKSEYTDSNRHAKRRRENDMYENLVHDMEFTFADEYYGDLQDDYYASLRKDLMDEEE